MKYDVAVKTFPERYAACVRMIAPTYEHEGMLWGILMEETAHLGMLPDDPCYCCAVFYDKEFREENVDLEVYKTVKGTCSDTEHVKFRTLPACVVASAICKGSYEQMDAVILSIAQWIGDNGYELDGPVFNIYHVSPHETDNPDEYITEVCYPVRKAGG